MTSTPHLFMEQMKWIDVECLFYRKGAKEYKEVRPKKNWSSHSIVVHFNISYSLPINIVCHLIRAMRHDRGGVVNSMIMMIIAIIGHRMVPSVKMKWRESEYNKHKLGTKPDKWWSDNLGCSKCQSDNSGFRALTDTIQTMVQRGQSLVNESWPKPKQEWIGKGDKVKGGEGVTNCHFVPENDQNWKFVIVDGRLSCVSETEKRWIPLYILSFYRRGRRCRLALN